MTTHRFTATVWHNVLGTLPPALHVASGDIVVTETLDAAGFDKHHWPDMADAGWAKGIHEFYGQTRSYNQPPRSAS